jgi:hypothetical protein
VSASLKVQQSCADPERGRSSLSARTSVLLIFDVVLCLALGLPLSAETAKFKDVSPKPPAVDKLAPGKAGPAATPAQTGSTNPADCVQPGVGEKSTADGGEVKDSVPSSVSSGRSASSGDPEVGAQSSSELITDKLKLSLEPRTDAASDPQAAPQCGREENGAQAKENGDVPPN